MPTCSDVVLSGVSIVALGTTHGPGYEPDGWTLPATTPDTNPGQRTKGDIAYGPVDVGETSVEWPGGGLGYPGAGRPNAVTVQFAGCLGPPTNDAYAEGT